MLLILEAFILCLTAILVIILFFQPITVALLMGFSYLAGFSIAISVNKAINIYNGEG